MSTICNKCGGIIPDIVFSNPTKRMDCKYHKKPTIDIKYPEKRFSDDRRLHSKNKNEIYSIVLLYFQ